VGLRGCVGLCGCGCSSGAKSPRPVLVPAGPDFD